MKIVQHHDYGMVLDTMPDKNGIVKDKIYFCFFKLDNGKILCVESYKSFNEKTNIYEWNEFAGVDEDGNDINLGPYSIHYSKDYTFGEDFLSWHHRSLNTKHNYDELKWPTEDEKKLVIDFYEKNLKDD